MKRLTLILFAALSHVAANSQVINGGFESGVSNWNQPCVCAPYQLSNDVPPGGGSWSLGVGIVDINCGCTVTEAVHQPTTWLYPGPWLLSAWIKNADPGNVPGASIRISDGPAFSSTVVSDVWSYAGVWTFVVDTFYVTSFTDIASLQVSLIPDDGNAMPPGLFAYFDQIMIQPIFSTGVDDRDIAAFSVQPNPAETVLSITLDDQVTEILLTDAIGRTSGAMNFQQNGDRITVDISGLSAGMWILKVITPGGRRIAGFVRR